MLGLFIKREFCFPLAKFVVELHMLAMLVIEELTSLGQSAHCLCALADNDPCQ